MRGRVTSEPGSAHCGNIFKWRTALLVTWCSWWTLRPSRAIIFRKKAYKTTRRNAFLPMYMEDERGRNHRLWFGKAWKAWNVRAPSAPAEGLYQRHQANCSRPCWMSRYCENRHRLFQILLLFKFPFNLHIFIDLPILWGDLWETSGCENFSF